METPTNQFKKAFHTVTTGKWILAGEHSVLRGWPALVFPLPSARLEFWFDPGDAGTTDIGLELSGPRGAELDLLFWGVLEKACALSGLHRHQLAGKVRIHSDIPVGAGLGASAAFCVAVARWFSFEGIVLDSGIEDFARELENLFHGESSGVDIAVAHGGKPIKFLRNGTRQTLNLKWSPSCFLTYSGQRGVTRECVEKVKELWAKDPALGQLLDQKMNQAVLDAERALQLPKNEGLPLLLKAMAEASQCFASWGLFEGVAESKAKALLEQGASVVKPTGSGGGGYLISVWPSMPQKNADLLPCFE